MLDFFKGLLYAFKVAFSFNLKPLPVDYTGAVQYCMYRVVRELGSRIPCETPDRVNEVSVSNYMAKGNRVYICCIAKDSSALSEAEYRIAEQRLQMKINSLLADNQVMSEPEIRFGGYPFLIVISVSEYEGYLDIRIVAVDNQWAADKLDYMKQPQIEAVTKVNTSDEDF